MALPRDATATGPTTPRSVTKASHDHQAHGGFFPPAESASIRFRAAGTYGVAG